MNYSHKALVLEIDGNVDEMSAAGVTRQVDFIRSRLILAKQDAVSWRGKTLRETGLIRIPVGTTGRILSFGEIDPEADEVKRASMWRTTIKDALDALSLIVRFGYFVTDVEKVSALKGGELFAAKEKMVRAVRQSGGLSWEVNKLHPNRSVGKVFQNWKAYVEEFHAWEDEIRAADEELRRVNAEVRAQAVAKANAAVAAIPTVDEVAVAFAENIGGTVGEPAPEAEKAVAQEERLDAVGTPNVVSMDSMAAEADEVSQLLNGMSREKLARVKAALAAREVGVSQSELAQASPNDAWRNQK